jgi:hypothetical protein
MFAFANPPTVVQPTRHDEGDEGRQEGRNRADQRRDDERRRLVEVHSVER